MEQPTPFGPATFWIETSIAAATAMMQAATSFQRSAAQMMTSVAPLNSPPRHAAAPEPAPTRWREPAPSPAPSSISRSWYRAPYRSPFDPMFWMSPGHPVDHVHDWLPWAAAGAAWMSPARFMSTSAALPDPMGAMRSFWEPWAMAAGPFAASPFLPSPSLASTNVIDFNAAFSAYRTAGGHAAAQIARSIPAAAERATTATAFMPFFAPWMFPLMPYGFGR